MQVTVDVCLVPQTLSPRPPDQRPERSCIMLQEMMMLVTKGNVLKTVYGIPPESSHTTSLGESSANDRECAVVHGSIASH